ncbi:MAG: TIGR00296 family protein [Thermoplasmata archaeon]|nr:TIGR00296 family protein [Thermoplasmata archaeon]
MARYPTPANADVVLTSEDGTAAVGLARRALQQGFDQPPGTDAAAPFRSVPLPAVLDEPRGVFVTLRRHPSNDLRGCIGFPLPVFPLRAAIPRAAWAAAVDDPRFPPVRRSELDRLTLELSVLTVPEPVDVEPRAAIAGQVKVGRHGLIVDRRGASGLLLPQVATEFGWTPAEFLAATCQKAGLPAEAWRQPGTTVRRFSAELFEETTPGGPVRPMSLAAHR